MTLNDSCHKPFFIFKTYVCHGYEGVMPVLCTPLQVKCYQLCLYRSLFYLLIYVLTALKTSETATLEMDMKSIKYSEIMFGNIIHADSQTLLVPNTFSDSQE